MEPTCGHFCKMKPRYVVIMRIIDISPGYRRRGEWRIQYLCRHHFDELRREMKLVGRAGIVRREWGKVARVILSPRNLRKHLQKGENHAENKENLSTAKASRTCE